MYLIVVMDWYDWYANECLSCNGNRRYGMPQKTHWVGCVHFDDYKTSSNLPCHKGGKYINTCKSVLFKCHVYKSKICK